MQNVDDYAEIAEIVRHHHERVDGNGYPDRLEGEAIPLLARIIAVADAYNAMTSDRPYRDAMPSRVARLRLAQAVESQFDTSVVAAFEAILATASEEYRMGRGPGFALKPDAVHRSADTMESGIAASAPAICCARLAATRGSDRDRFGSGVNTQFLEDVPDVHFGGRLADKQPSRDFAI